MSKKGETPPLPADVKEQDTFAKAARRNLSPRRALSLLGRGARSLYAEGAEATARKIGFRLALLRKGEIWPYKSDLPTRRQWKAQRKTIFEKMPIISIAVPLFNTNPRFLREMIESCLNQSYQNWELCLADASEDDKVGRQVQRYKDPRIRYQKLTQNGGIAANTTAALQMSGGQYIGLLDHDDTLRSGTLFEVVKAVNKTGADFIYSDEIVLDETLQKLKGFHFKPDFSPDYLRGCNYITHFSVFSRVLAEKAGFYEDPAMDGAQDHDLILRLTEQAQVVAHIPKVLYTWRAHAASTAGDAGAAKPYAVAAGQRAVQAQLHRLGLKGEVQPLAGPGSYRVRYATEGAPLVSVIIPNKDHAADLQKCLESLVSKAGHAPMECIVVENASQQPETFAYYEAAQKHYPWLRVVRFASQGPFNFAAVCNAGAKESKGEHLLFLNNDIALESGDFIREMLMFSQRQDVGAVGAKLLYPDGTIQHGGVFVGLGGSAGHSHKGHPGTSQGDMYRLAIAQNVSAVTGACLMVKKALFEKLGGFDAEIFGVAFNDVDFCLRLRALGLWNVFTPFAVATHAESKTRGYESGESAARFEREKAAFRQKYAALLAAGDPFYNPHLTLEFENYAIG